MRLRATMRATMLCVLGLAGTLAPLLSAEASVPRVILAEDFSSPT